MEVRARDANATLFTFCGAYCQNTSCSPDKGSTDRKNIILIATDLMHHGTSSTCICCGGYREWRHTNPLVLLPKSFGSSSHLYVTQPCYFSNFSLTVGEARNIYIKLRKSAQVNSNPSKPSALPSDLPFTVVQF